MFLRKIIVVLAAPLLALGAANVVLYVRGDAPSQATPHALPVNLQCWLSLSRAQRAAFVQLYQDIAQRPEARTVWHGARQFEQLPAARQDALRTLQRVLHETLAREASSGRRDLLRAPPRAQAFFVYQALAAEDPQRIGELAKLLRGTRTGR